MTTMEIKNYEQSCRFCLNNSRDMLDLFTYVLEPTGLNLVDFIRKITDLKIVKGEYLPNNLCINCIDSINAAYSFSQMCTISDNVLKKEETRREFRKIEQEALFDENDLGNEILVVDLCGANHHESILSVKCEDAILQESKNIGFDDFSDLSDADSLPDITKPSEKIQVVKMPVKVKEKYNCDFCKTRFSNKVKFLGHQKLHDETKAFKCSLCLQHFLKEAHLRVHLRSHAKSEEKNYSCNTCGKNFIYEYLLKQHEYKHSDNKPFPCSKCDKGCLTAENLRRHMKIHDENYVKKVYSCSICRKEFPYPSSFSDHMKLHTGEKPHLCSVCGKGFRQTGSLNFHQRIHTGFKPFKCDMCLECFKSRSLLKVHMRIHTKERPFVCASCGMTFRQSNDLTSHMRTHTGERPFLCTLCGKKMSTTGQLTVHLRTHTGEKPYKCETCEKTFATKTVLQKHERIHTGERPYVCTICNKAFNQSSTLKTHSKIHSLKPENVINTTGEKKKTKTKKISPKDKATVKVMVDNEEKVCPNVRTQFTMILPAPIPLLQPLDDDKVK